jgi:hypothetical protein
MIHRHPVFVFLVVCLLLGAPTASGVESARKPQLGSPQQAWRSVEDAVHSGRHDAIVGVTTPRGYRLLVGSLDLAGADGRAELLARWQPWFSSPVRWEEKSANTYAALFLRLKGGPRLTFVKVVGEWRLDELWPGK